MSLDSLSKMRRTGYRPKVVNVIVGKPPAWFVDGPDVVVIREQDNPDLMDMRPLLKMPVSVIEVGRNEPLMTKTLTALETAQARVYGIAGSAGTVGVGPEHERTMNRYREALCN